ncbi:hypothetical protein [Streptomyces benahoarensis]|uniref:Uncharacterized protein n=1 Tax=Streptomyces benahoarensis TaxID=2595054 RepID=A0A553ZFR0_9ACTN|nr:hypothetical protein [Streptomyces benahoarensis]TSB21438.1 hypothetical protein FNJ62_18560 [Streptomyces benahoarensis]TSB40285.1 hypothetical protein FNZ23_14045 [Streptomyces benahoarensis]
MTGYLAEVRLETRPSGPGEGATYTVCALWTVSPVLAVRWLRGQALRLAERVGSEPVRSPWAWLTRGAADVPDHAAKVRAWAWDAGEERAAREHIKRGHALFVTLPEAERTHTLSIWPGQPPGEAGQPPPEPFRHRIGGLSHPLHVLAEDPWR